jgi:protein-S-isoprenylcysteine O-methyltransferase Ste14
VSTLNKIALAELLLCWALWMFRFFLRSREQRDKTPSVTAPAARWGLGFQVVGLSLAWPRTSESNPAVLTVASMIVAPLSTRLVWRAVGHLGKQWRIQAWLYADHELIRSGPYRFVRHPIYASMLGMFLATGFIMAWWPVLLSGAVFFLIGTEIRVRAEDGLLRSRFGKEFERYKDSVPAYIPLVR